LVLSWPRILKPDRPQTSVELHVIVILIGLMILSVLLTSDCVLRLLLHHHGKRFLMSSDRAIGAPCLTFLTASSACISYIQVHQR